ncbi:hypothetical protein MKZ38_006081 [Zalerion maritima]|uniref:Uncharacterized protein n=1 Tax=Zalerion maritima TaxID=339359 RepID=A0AAD5RVS1_9PEZI|nr:hypothetical protein MKZ38_006081 [Zalerion maritima]
MRLLHMAFEQISRVEIRSIEVRETGIFSIEDTEPGVRSPTASAGPILGAEQESCSGLIKATALRLEEALEALLLAVEEKCLIHYSATTRDCTIATIDTKLNISKPQADLSCLINVQVGKRDGWAAQFEN